LSFIEQFIVGDSRDHCADSERRAELSFGNFEIAKAKADSPDAHHAVVEGFGGCVGQVPVADLAELGAKGVNRYSGKHWLTFSQMVRSA
jgi:hypothetical protein